MCLLIATPLFAGDPLSFNSSWNYQQAGGDNTETSRFGHNYNLTYNKELSAAMALSGSLRYSESLPSEGSASRTISPRLSYDLRNDLFSLNLNAAETRSESDGAATRINDNWGANFSSAIENWPSVRFYFSQSMATDDQQPKRTDTVSNSAGASIDYSYGPFEMLYDANLSQTTNEVESSESRSMDQTAQLSYSGSFFRGRVSVSASQQYKMTESSSDSAAIAGVAFDVDLATIGRYYIEDDTPVDAALGADTFVGKNILDASVGVQDENMTIQLNSPLNDVSPINGAFNKLKVWLYREIGSDRVPLLSTDLLDDTGDWAIYYRNEGDLFWTQITAANFTVAVSEDVLNGELRTVVELSLSGDYAADYVKVVSLSETAIPGREAYVDDIVAYNSFVPTTDVVSLSRDNTTIQSQFSTSVRITDRWSVSYSFRRVENQADYGDTLQLSQSLTSAYRLSEKVGFALAVTDSIDESDNAVGRENRSYSMSVNALPLPTVNFSLAYTRGENSSDDGRNTVSDSLSSTVSAVIYPELTAALSSNWSKSENSSEGTESSSYGNTLRMTARLSPKADLDVDVNYSQSESSGGETTSSTSYGVDFGYRPSDMLLLDISYDADVEGGTSSLAGYTSWLWSRKLQSRFGFAYEFADEIEQIYNAQVSWLISRNLSLQANGNYSIGEEETNWNLSSSLNMVF